MSDLEERFSDALHSTSRSWRQAVDRKLKYLGEASTTDRRVKRVILTPAGMKIYEKVKAEATSLRRDLLAKTDQKKLLLATELLEGLQGIIDKQS
jgi:MarR family transcriptional regulator for hemolysin